MQTNSEKKYDTLTNSAIQDSSKSFDFRQKKKREKNMNKIWKKTNKQIITS